MAAQRIFVPAHSLSSLCWTSALRGGPSMVDAVPAALVARLVGVLITDGATAEALADRAT